MTRDHRDDGDPAAGCALAFVISLLAFAAAVLILQLLRWWVTS